MNFVNFTSPLLLAVFLGVFYVNGQSIDVGPTVTDCTCDHRYFKHYEAKKCKPVYDDVKNCQCPKRFECDDLNLDPNVCVLNGVKYQIGNRVNSTNNCQICTCRKHFLTGKATIECIGIECGHNFRPPTRGCFLYYEADKCCPSEKCETDVSDKKEDTKVCNYNGKDYKIGQRIYPEEDPCLSCLCTENWTGINNSSCKTFNCEIEKNVHKLANGCIPIYHEKTCCPIEYHCVNEDANVNNKTRLTSPQRPEEGKCFFGGRNYGVGEILDIKHPTNCVSCQCQVPPDFTCIHRTCPRPPNNDYDNCVPIYKTNSCCAEYNCTVPEKKEQKCPEVNCTTNPFCKEIIQPDGCPMCECIPLCSPPLCEGGCTIQTNVPEGQCPGCDCPTQ